VQNKPATHWEGSVHEPPCGTGVLVGVVVGVFVGVAVGVAVGVFVGVTVGVAVGVFVGVDVGVTVGVSTGCGNRSSQFGVELGLITSCPPGTHIRVKSHREKTGQLKLELPGGFRASIVRVKSGVNTAGLSGMSVTV
jgi:hypothetical protein